MSRIDHFLIRAIFSAVLFAAGAAATSAQMTIFNIPSTDTLPHGSVYVELDVITKPVPYRDGGYQTYGYRTVYGLNNKTEIGANFFYTRNGGESTGELQFDAKRKVYDNEKHGVAVSGGTIVYVPVKNTSGSRPIVVVYGNVSKKIEPLNGLRLTAGAYSVFNGGSSFGTKNGMMLGLEQPLAKRLSFLADWYSGRNRLGYSAAGLNYGITKRQFVNAGYNFGNSGRGNNAFSAYYAYLF